MAAWFGFEVDSASTSKADAAMDRLSAKARALGGYLSGAASALRTFTLGIAGLAVGAFGVGFVKTTFAVDKLRVSLLNATGSAEKANAAFKFVQDLEPASPDGILELTEAYQMLFGRGIDPTRESMIRLMDAAAFAGTPIQEFIFAMGGAAIGNAEALETMTSRVGISFRSMNGVLYAQLDGTERRIGKTFADIVAFMDEIGAGRAKGSAERLSRTLGGMWSTLSSAVTQFFTAVADAGAGDGLKGLIDKLTQLARAGSPLAKMIGERLGRAFGVLGGMLDNLAKDPARLDGIFKAIAGTFQVFVDLLTWIADHPDETVAALKAFGVAIAAAFAEKPIQAGWSFATMLKDIALAAPAVAGWLLSIAKLTGWAARFGVLARVGTAVAGAWAAVAAVFTGAVTASAAAMSAAVIASVGAILATVNNVTAAIQGRWEDVWGEGLVEYLSRSIEDAITLFAYFKEWVVESLGGLFDWLGEKFDWLTDAVSRGFTRQDFAVAGGAMDGWRYVPDRETRGAALTGGAGISRAGRAAGGAGDTTQVSVQTGPVTVQAVAGESPEELGRRVSAAQASGIEDELQSILAQSRRRGR